MGMTGEERDEDEELYGRTLARPAPEDDLVIAPMGGEEGGEEGEERDWDAGLSLRDGETFDEFVLRHRGDPAAPRWTQLLTTGAEARDYIATHPEVVAKARALEDRR